MRSTAGPAGESERGHAISDPPAKPPRHRKRLSAFRKTLFALVTTAGLIALPEALCRLVGLGKQQPVAEHVSDWHRALDGRSFWVLRGGGRNTDGLRDREHAVEKPPGVFRIVCLGDSVTEGFGPQPSRVYSRHFEALLKQAGLPMEVLNVAVAGWSTLQEVTAYRAIARKYRPDQVFLEFCLNDVAEMHNNLAQPPPAAMAMLLRHSALFRWLVNAEGRQVRSVRELFDNPEAAAVKSGWRRVFDELLVLQRETRITVAPCRSSSSPFGFSSTRLRRNPSPSARCSSSAGATTSHAWICCPRSRRWDLMLSWTIAISVPSVLKRLPRSWLGGVDPDASHAGTT